MANALVLDSLPAEQVEYADFLRSLGFRVDVGKSYAEARACLEKRPYALLLLDPYLTYAYDGEDLLDWAENRSVPFAVVVINDLAESPVMQQMVVHRKRLVLTMKAQDFPARKAEIAALVCRHRLLLPEPAKPGMPNEHVPHPLDTLKVVFALVCLIGVTLGFGWVLERLTGSVALAGMLSVVCLLTVTAGVCALFGKSVKEAAGILKDILPKGPPKPADG